MKIKSKDIRMVPIDELIPNPRNRNDHPEKQIDHLVEQFKYQGFRSPVIVSNRTGFVVAGHGRLIAAKRAGLKQLPAIFQDFDSDEQEYAFGVAENATQGWSELDMSGINADIVDLGPDFNIEMLGIEDFSVDPADGGASGEVCPECGSKLKAKRR
jgi:hypothetical protein